MTDQDFFHNEMHYKRYLYALVFAERINSLLDSGYIVINNHGEILPEKARFIFREGDSPALLLKWSDIMSITYLDTRSDDIVNKYFLRTKKEWDHFFSSWKVVHPKNIKRFRL